MTIMTCTCRAYDIQVQQAGMESQLGGSVNSVAFSAASNNTAENTAHAGPMVLTATLKLLLHVCQLYISLGAAGEGGCAAAVAGCCNSAQVPAHTHPSTWHVRHLPAT